MREIYQVFHITVFALSFVYFRNQTNFNRDSKCILNRFLDLTVMTVLFIAIKIHYLHKGIMIIFYLGIFGAMPTTAVKARNSYPVSSLVTFVFSSSFLILSLKKSGSSMVHLSSPFL